jgi:[ribosomal protein S5]-alanine N-acetyltransferase
MNAYPRVFPRIETPNFVLGEILPSHLHDLYALFSLPEVCRYYNLLPLKSPDEAQRILDFFREGFVQQTRIRWAIIPTGETQLVGTIGFNHFAINHRANIGYDLHPTYWNRGWMHQAIEHICHYGFEQLHVNRIEAEVMIGNIPSEKTLLKAGFTHEALLHDWLLFNQKHHDMNLFYKLRKNV